MKYFALILILLNAWINNTTEQKLLKRLEQLYNNAYKWQISRHYYKMAKYFSYNKLADKAFIMLTRANQSGFYKFKKIYRDKIFKSLRSLKYWKNFKNIGKKPVNYTVSGYYFKQNPAFKRRLYTRILNKILNNNDKKLSNQFSSFFLIKAYTKAGQSVYEGYYKYEGAQRKFIKYKFVQYSKDGKKIYEYNLKDQKSLYYFYYKDNFWIVYYKEDNGKINWGLSR